MAVVPDFAALTDYPMLRVLRIAGPPLPWELSLATASHGRPSPALRALLPLLDRHISGP
ncbi:hypothetical protein OIE69_01060 [Actinacidiphila glaucinigra]|uniref:hypothetical protein n=1 Tax=Actinacidiphila glaucinigra TaxID=235986 RepID=UPI002DD9CB6A|nr:hypothetical protein [Actinacidiphila glaucinigra]WSD57617.1 hypothetical protein OIE69_01060 [Actinacidiphila glaucinigra]